MLKEITEISIKLKEGLEKRPQVLPGYQPLVTDKEYQLICEKYGYRSCDIGLVGNDINGEIEARLGYISLTTSHLLFNQEALERESLVVQKYHNSKIEDLEKVIEHRDSRIRYLDKKLSEKNKRRKK